jgi:type II secretory ATPase GspE/PulE/Tfp pilus assembly ATPase PilB-like protein
MEPGVFQRGAGCAACDFTGVRGRSGVFEIMEVRTDMRDTLIHGTESELRLMLKAKGVQTLTQQAVERVVEGMISVPEAYRTCYLGSGVNE